MFITKQRKLCLLRCYVLCALKIAACNCLIIHLFNFSTRRMDPSYIFERSDCPRDSSSDINGFNPEDASPDEFFASNSPAAAGPHFFDLLSSPAGPDFSFSSSNLSSPVPLSEFDGWYSLRASPNRLSSTPRPSSECDYSWFADSDSELEVI